MKEIQDVALDIEDQGHIGYNVSVNIWKYDDGSYEFIQHVLIDSIVDDIGLYYAKATAKLIPTAI